ncbi:hypothetical protein N7456_010021 [Penicillium angulare]|uniref:Sulfotransferase n=1 Tax=Penicillium angulare TaxID=116970 RepID=A0A9W9F5T7_9EURO|nr:hypothetical protein N7456_010021 [Penicillium angulare]
MAVIDLPQANGTNGAHADPRRILLISIPRTASNLLLKILNIPKQPNLLTSPKGGYFFYPAFLENAAAGLQFEKPGDQWTKEEKNKAQESFQKCLDSLEEWSTKANDENQVMFSKEHAYWMFSPAALQEHNTGVHDEEFFKSFRVNTPEKYSETKTYSASNQTIFSDEYLQSWKMAFIIRHPALAWPSMYRAMLKLHAVGMIDEDGVKGSSFTHMTMKWTRMLYDWCLEQPDAPVAPPVIDAHDLIHHPEVVLQLCDQLGLDKNVVQFEWKDKNEPKKSLQWATHNPDATAEEVKFHQTGASFMLSTLEESTGIVKDKAPETIDIEAELVKWKEEFGEEVGLLVYQAVKSSMPDYEYLTARRLTV